MPEPNLFNIFIGPLNNLDVRYMVTGAVASVIYGEPRLTNDIDLVVELNAKKAKDIMKLFPQEAFYCPPLEVIKVEINRDLRGHFNIIHHRTGFKADIYLTGKDELHHWAMSNRKELLIEGGAVWVAPLEYVVLRKLQYYKEGGSQKHLRDIEGMLEVSSDQADIVILDQKTKEYGLYTEWRNVLTGARSY